MSPYNSVSKILLKGRSCNLFTGIASFCTAFYFLKMSSQFHVPKSFDNKMTLLNLKDGNSDNLTADSESATVSSDEDMLNDFLTLKAKRLISSLQNKKQSLEDDLKYYKCDIGNMSFIALIST
ncbi:hypothetical protein Anas_12463 [Armadillidium nasatum]|uniref:Uncharacterized protein n=1 Tax=Armadillidium nasatum TaxID=96803 RepID=A0A5N5T5J7_9CRUS|nr:hypothetical protein Anas_12463 [Armadillidium nasatum]